MNQNRYSTIDLLRFIAASTVALSHLIITKSEFNLELEIISSMSVEIFFIISGFVLAPQIINLVKKKSLNDYKIFLLRRWYRTIPLYILSLILTSIILNNILTFDFIKYLFFIQNFYINFLSNDYFSISWSLSVEEWFYILFPLFLIIVSKKIFLNEEKNIIFSCILFIIIIFLIRITLSDNENWGENVRRVVIYRLDSIAFGFILFFFKDEIKSKLINQIFLLILLIPFSFFAFYILKMNVLENLIFFKVIFHYIIALWASIIVIYFFIIDQKIKNKSIVNLNLFLGKISYSIYLFHLMLIYIITSISFIPFYLTVIIFLFVQIFLSTFLYYYFEKPILLSRPDYDGK